jgi:hypothetical protein
VFLKQFPPSVVLRVTGIADLEPVHAVSRILAFGDDAFEVLFANALEEVEPTSVDVLGEENG